MGSVWWEMHLEITFTKASGKITNLMAQVSSPLMDSSNMKENSEMASGRDLENSHYSTIQIKFAFKELFQREPLKDWARSSINKTTKSMKDNSKMENNMEEESGWVLKETSTKVKFHFKFRRICIRKKIRQWSVCFCFWECVWGKF